VLSGPSLHNMSKLSSILATAAVVAVVTVLMAMEICHGSEDVFSGCNVPPKFWCSSEKVARDCQVWYNTNRVVPVWNSLPNEVVMADNINLFKKRLGKTTVSNNTCIH